MKKIIAFFLIVSLCLTAGCSSNNSSIDSSEPVDLEKEIVLEPEVSTEPSTTPKVNNKPRLATEVDKEPIESPEPKPEPILEPARKIVETELDESNETKFFDEVYVDYANRKKSEDFGSVKVFAENCEYAYEINEPTEERNGTIKIYKDNELGDYVYFTFVEKKQRNRYYNDYQLF